MVPILISHTWLTSLVTSGSTRLLDSVLFPDLLTTSGADTSQGWAFLGNGPFRKITVLVTNFHYSFIYFMCLHKFYRIYFINKPQSLLMTWEDENWYYLLAKFVIFRITNNFYVERYCNFTLNYNECLNLKKNFLTILWSNLFWKTKHVEHCMYSIFNYFSKFVI